MQFFVNSLFKLLGLGFILFGAYGLGGQPAMMLAGGIWLVIPARYF